MLLKACNMLMKMVSIPMMMIIIMIAVMMMIMMMIVMMMMMMMMMMVWCWFKSWTTLVVWSIGPYPCIYTLIHTLNPSVHLSIHLYTSLIILMYTGKLDIDGYLSNGSTPMIEFIKKNYYNTCVKMVLQHDANCNRVNRQSGITWWLYEKSLTYYTIW